MKDLKDIEKFILGLSIEQLEKIEQLIPMQEEKIEEKLFGRLKNIYTIEDSICNLL